MDIKLQGVKNIRDFTEYGFQGYIRSAHLHDMTESDAESLLKDYKLRMVIDLRTGVEKNEQPDHVMEGVEYLHIPLFNVREQGNRGKGERCFPGKKGVYGACY
nr:tyrosine-protein phosphatase [uncultured Acetatifactor sp.]